MTKAVLNIIKTLELPTSFIFKQTTLNPEHPCEVRIAKPVICMCDVWRMGVRFSMPHTRFRFIIYSIEAIYVTDEMNSEVL